MMKVSPPPPSGLLKSASSQLLTASIVEFLLCGDLPLVHHHLPVRAASSPAVLLLHLLLLSEQLNRCCLLDFVVISSSRSWGWIALFWGKNVTVIVVEGLVGSGGSDCCSLGEAFMSGLAKRVVLALDVHQDPIKGLNGQLCLRHGEKEDS